MARAFPNMKALFLLRLLLAFGLQAEEAQYRAAIDKVITMLK